MKVNPFFKSYTFYRHCLYALAIVISLVIMVLFGLKIYTRHNIFFIVPNLYGLNLNEAEKITEKDNLHIKITDSIYIKDTEAGTIIDQRPKANIKVKKYRTLAITICSSRPESIPFPDIKNMAFRQSLSTLINLGFKIRKIKYKEHQYKNLVLELRYKNDSIAPGTLIEKGSEIDMILGKGQNNKVLIPLLIGKTLDEATILVNYSYLNKGKAHKDKTIKNIKDRKLGRIWKQSPEYSKERMLEAGEIMTVWISLDRARLLKADSIVRINRNLSKKRW